MGWETWGRERSRLARHPVTAAPPCSLRGNTAPRIAHARPTLSTGFSGSACLVPRRRHVPPFAPPTPHHPAPPHCRARALGQRGPGPTWPGAPRRGRKTHRGRWGPGGQSSGGAGGGGRAGRGGARRRWRFKATGEGPSVCSPCSVRSPAAPQASHWPPGRPAPSQRPRARSAARPRSGSYTRLPLEVRHRPQVVAAECADGHVEPQPPARGGLRWRQAREARLGGAVVVALAGAEQLQGELRGV
jgi:hypothetical protein